VQDDEIAHAIEFRELHAVVFGGVSGIPAMLVAGSV
jgi:hypothetical protein